MSIYLGRFGLAIMLTIIYGLAVRIAETSAIVFWIFTILFAIAAAIMVMAEGTDAH